MKKHKFDRFGFSSLPFRNDSKAAYVDTARKQVLKNMLNFLNYRGFAVLSGSSGTGKTMLLNHLCKQLNPNENKIIYIPFSMLSQSDMLKSICVKLNVEPTVSTSKMLARIQDCITQMQPINPILVLDEIQKITNPTIEIIRLMTNINFEEKNLFSILMAGNDEFLQRVRLRINEPLRQRITCYCRLDALSRSDTKEYIKCQFETAGAHQDIITEQAAMLVYDLTSGIPRMINSLVFAALEMADEDESQIIDLKHINLAEKVVILPQQEPYQ